MDPMGYWRAKKKKECQCGGDSVISFKLEVHFLKRLVSYGVTGPNSHLSSLR